MKKLKIAIEHPQINDIETFIKKSGLLTDKNKVELRVSSLGPGKNNLEIFDLGAGLSYYKIGDKESREKIKQWSNLFDVIMKKFDIDSVSLFDRYDTPIYSTINRERSDNIWNLKMSKELKYKVGIHKSYFPKELWPKEMGSSSYDMILVKANSRKEAANKAWKLKGKDWLSKMIPKQTSVRKISLYVNDPLAGTGGFMERLQPILVYQD